ncbi:hypothetical protein K8S19_11175 [bacterium]|nr:hypothetical protein [bacterium]
MLKDIYAKLKSLKKQEERKIEADCLDLVFYTRDTAQWLETLESLLGAPLKAPGQSAPKEAKQIAKNYGGIQKEQCLFKQDHDQSMIVAMLWPWQNGKCTTLKMFLTDRLPKKPGGGFFSFLKK